MQDGDVLAKKIIYYLKILKKLVIKLLASFSC